jgi:hypothetical protein
MLPQSASPVRANPAELPARDVPWMRAYQPAVLALVRLGYPLRELERAYAHLAVHRTAECCPAVRPEHRAEVEATLPRDPAWDSAWWDDLAFSPSA